MYIYIIIKLNNYDTFSNRKIENIIYICNGSMFNRDRYCSRTCFNIWIMETENTFNYKLLGRLVSDCDYFLGYGNRCEKHLWSGNVKDQIDKMKELWNNFSEKPEWLTMEQIETYEKEMI